MNVLVIDIGGSHVKAYATAGEASASFDSGPAMTPQLLIQRLQETTSGWHYEVVAIGYPGRVTDNRPSDEPGNLDRGWIGFDFGHALDKPVRLVNDASLQALGAYQGGRMLFLGLGTGLGSALVSERVVVPLELGNLPYGDRTIAEAVNKEALQALGAHRWQRNVQELVPALRHALLADYVVLGGGNAGRVNPLPEGARRGGNDDARAGGVRLWEELVEPLDKQPSQHWRVVT